MPKLAQTHQGVRFIGDIFATTPPPLRSEQLWGADVGHRILTSVYRHEQPVTVHFSEMEDGGQLQAAAEG